MPTLDLFDIGLDSEQFKKDFKNLINFVEKNTKGIDLDVSTKETLNRFKKLEKDVDKLGTKAGKGFGDGFSKEVKKDVKKSEATFKKGGKVAGQKFESGFKSGFDLKSVLAGAGGLALLQTGFRALTQGVKSAVEQTTEFEASVADLSAITGLQGDALDDFAGRARNLSKEFGTTATEQVESFKAVISRFGPDIAGTPEAVDSIANSINTLAKAAGLDATQSMDALTTSALQFGVDLSDPIKAAEEISVQMNVLAAASKEGAAEVPQVAEAVKIAGALAQKSNVSFTETAAAIETLALAGLTGAEAGTKLRGILVGLQKITPQAAKGLQSIGINADDLGETLVEDGLNAAMIELKEGLENIEEPAKKNALITQLFGKQNLAAALTMVESTEATANFTERLTGTNTAVEQAATKMASFDEVMKRAKASLNDVALEVGGALIPVFETIIEALKPVIDVIVKNVLPPLINIIESLAPLFQSIFEEVGKAVGDILVPLANTFSLLIKAIKPLIDAVLPPLLRIFTKLVGKLTPIIDRVLPPLIDIFTELAAEVMPIVESAFDELLPVMDDIIDAFLEALPPLVELAKDLLPLLVDVLKILIPWNVFLAKVFGEVLVITIKVVNFFREGLILAIRGVIAVIKPFVEAAGWLAKAVGVVAEKTAPLADKIEKTTEKTKDLGESSKETTGEVEGLGGSVEGLGLELDELETDEPADGITDFGDAAQKAEVKASDLIKKLAELTIAGKGNTKEFDNIFNSVVKLSAKEAEFKTVAAGLTAQFADQNREFAETQKRIKTGFEISNIESQLSEMKSLGLDNTSVYKDLEKKVFDLRESIKTPLQLAQWEAFSSTLNNIRDAATQSGGAIAGLQTDLLDLPTIEVNPVAIDRNEIGQDITFLEEMWASIGDTAESSLADISGALGGAFAEIITGTEDAGDALIGVLLGTLEAMIPVIVAQIFAIEAGSKGIGALVTVPIVTGILLGLVQAAKAAVGAEEGGEVGSSTFSGKVSSRDTIPILAHKGERFTPKEKADSNPVIDYIIKGGSEKDYFVNTFGKLDFTETKESYKSVNMTMPSQNNQALEGLLKAQIAEQRITNEKLDQNSLINVYKNYSFKDERELRNMKVEAFR